MLPLMMKWPVWLERPIVPSQSRVVSPDDFRPHSWARCACFGLCAEQNQLPQLQQSLTSALCPFPAAGSLLHPCPSSGSAVSPRPAPTRGSFCRSTLSR
uniref:Alternative protein C22orf29 n=1 Tax=Homo sapiens TaxID=9606 RepID=L0R4V2_HUMAN|nr:alternative protein C22orf29 [Homo sapiens]